MSKKIKDREGISKKRRKSRTAQKTPIDRAFLEKVFSVEEPRRKVPESPGGFNRIGKTPKLALAGRRCACCGAALSAYNNGKFCWPCDKAIGEWKNFSRRRSEIEREMSPYCLEYVKKNFPEGKRRRNASGEEISSGSFARALGRKQVERD